VEAVEAGRRSICRSMRWAAARPVESENRCPTRKRVSSLGMTPEPTGAHSFLSAARVNLWAARLSAKRDRPDQRRSRCDDPPGA